MIFKDKVYFTKKNAKIKTMLLLLVCLLFASTSFAGYSGLTFRKRVILNEQLDHCIKMCGRPNTAKPTYVGCVNECRRMFP